MIIVKLRGGLGNQMFQYAAARRLSHASRVPLKLDLSWFDGVGADTTRRSYQLHPFDIVHHPATPEEIASFPPPATPAGRLLARYLPGRKGYLLEKHFHFDASLLKPRRRAYLDGYWQSERYFEDAKEVIARDFSFTPPLEGENLALAQALRDCGKGSVALHLRRGDYVHNKAVADYHGACSQHYYAAAAREMAARLESPHFFIFSDDPEWVRGNFLLPYRCTFVGHNPPEAAWEDMRLMSLCRHHIVANSTFSWWGAWLAAHPAQLVVAPRRWFGTARLNAKDVVPGTWIRL